jgi:hypothetical protein
MVEQLGSSSPPASSDLKHLVEQVPGVRINSRTEDKAGGACKHGLEGRHFARLGVRHPQRGEDAGQLVGIADPREQRLRVQHLVEDAAQGEDVDRGAVQPGVEDLLGRAVPARGNVLGQGRPRSDLSGQTEIAEFDHPVFEQDVFGFQVAVKETTGVRVGQGG